MKRVSIFLIAAALIAGMVGCGPGGDNLPHSQNLEIRTWYDLNAIRNNLAGNHTLLNDLNSTTPGYTELASSMANGGKGWRPIGYGYWAGTQVLGEIFKGTFDGQGYGIRDLYINDPDGCQAGLFGFVGEGGIIKNLGVMNTTVTGCDGVGGLVGFNEDNVRCLIGVMWVAGGLVGYNGGTVSNCYAMGNVTADGEVGGLAGYNGGTVTNSYSSGNVTGHDYVGGLVGVNDGAVSDSYSTSSVTGATYVGGLVGDNSGTVSKCYSNGDVTGNSSVGGLVGVNDVGGAVSNSFWDIQTSGQTYSAGGTGENTTQMQDITTFLGAGWNIIAVTLNQTNPAYIWNIVDNVTYPFLSWQS